MKLTFIGIDPATDTDESPTVWVDEEAEDLVFQSYTADDETVATCARTQIPGHSSGCPEGEGIFRVPFRMVPMIREACDVAERSHRRRLAQGGEDVSGSS
ncbi:hypothetical protein [Kitasatospora purpeofusca]|uniref:hypothetical protein n=1 Tax=Kitasatospora purpeofusca TaxID=67352 RepID=UPI0038672980|nr:hypothetical protein OIP63_12070 [Kitasatospora purpeofusca]